MVQTLEKEKVEFHGFWSDTIFKNVCTVEGYLKRLLQSTLDLTVKDVSVLSNNEMPVLSIKERRKFLDLIITTDKGVINCELNYGYKDELHNRNFLYFCKLISSSINRCESYTSVDKHIQLNLTWNLQSYMPFDITGRKVIKCFIKDDETNNKLYDDIFQIYYINMDYFEDIWYHGDIEREDPFLMFLAAKTEEQMDRISEGDELMEEVNDRVKVLNLDPEIARELVIEDEDRLIRNTLLEAGEAKGRNDAIRETALNMLKDKVDINIISKYTGLSISDIEKLKLEDN